MSTDESTCGCDSCRCGTDSGARPPGEDAEASSLPWSHEGDFHPMGEAWESEMRAMLDDTEHDTELGMAMAKDAMRLVAGELTEEEFHEEYHDAVVSEFGTDDRPLPEALAALETVDGGGIVERLQNIGEGDLSRRETMKKMGFGAAAIGLGGGFVDGGNDDADAAGDAAPAATQQEPDDDDGDGVQYGMVIDLERCDGCLQCVVGCMDENDTSTGANWMYVLTYEDEETAQEHFLVRPCQHCSNAPCAKVCPVAARHTREDGGFVMTDYETCIGCRYCQVACPYGVNYFQWGEPDVPFADVHDDHTRDERGRWVDSRPPKGVMGKCTFCPSRQDGLMGEDLVGTVACMDACDNAGMYAIHFGDLNDPDSRPRRYLERRAEQAFEQDTQFDEPEEEYEETVTPWGKLSAFRLLEEMGTEPNVIYLGNEPGPNDEQVEGPVAYDRIGTVDRRKDHLDQFTVGPQPSGGGGGSNGGDEEQ